MLDDLHAYEKRARKGKSNKRKSIYLALLGRIDLVVGIARVVDDAVTAIDDAAISVARFARRLASERRTDAFAVFALIVFRAEIVVVAGAARNV